MDTHYFQTHEVEDFMHTHIKCGCCQQEIEATDELILLQIAEAKYLFPEEEVQPLLGVTGDYKFPPLFVHLGWCWRDIDEGIREKVSDEPPVNDPEAFLLCKYCKSGIRVGEYFAFAQEGELHCSPRFADDGSGCYVFQPWKDVNSSHIRICISCIISLGDEALTDWQEVSQIGECYYCNKARCWRDAYCKCFCHEP